MVSSMKLNPQDHRALESGLTTLHVTRLGRKKVHKVPPELRPQSGQCSGRPQAVYKVALRIIGYVGQRLCIDFFCSKSKFLNHFVFTLINSGPIYLM